MKKEPTTITEKQWSKQRKLEGLSIKHNPAIPKGTKPYEDWELRLLARDNNLVAQRSKRCDRFMTTIRELKKKL